MMPFGDRPWARSLRQLVTGVPFLWPWTDGRDCQGRHEQRGAGPRARQERIHRGSRGGAGGSDHGGSAQPARI